MPEIDVFERSLAGAFLRLADDLPGAVDAGAVAHRVALEHPRRRTTVLRWRLIAIPRRAWVLLLLAGLLAALVGGMLVAGSQMQRRLLAVLPPVGQVFECPSGSTPDKPGPVDQARPAGERSATAFDRRAGMLVVVTNAGDGIETWTFDVCTNTWARMHPNREPPGFEYTPLVYDIDSDVTIGVSTRKVWSYELQANIWTEKGSAPTDSPVSLAYDPVSGVVVAAEHSDRKLMWTYDVEADTWTPISQANGPDYPVIAYDASVDRLVAYGDGTGGAPPYETWLFDLRAGTWSWSAADRPAVVGWLTAPGLVYDEAAERTLIFDRDPLTAYDARTDRWEILAIPETLSTYPVPTVYDAVNRRLVGWRMGGNRNQESGVVAFDLTNRKWSVLLEPSGRSSSTPAARPAPTSARTAAPPAGTDETGLTSPVPTPAP